MGSVGGWGGGCQTLHYDPKKITCLFYIIVTKCKLGTVHTLLR